MRALTWVQGERKARRKMMSSRRSSGDLKSSTKKEEDSRPNSKDADIKLKKKLSRKGSADCSERKARCGMRSNRRLLEKRLNTSMMTSIPSNLAKGNALEHVNGLTLDEQIALKLARKK
jgi:hypothetical protein